jgi:hypothetical protein
MSRKAKEILVNEETKTIPISDPFTPEFEREREAWIQKNQRPREFISNESSLKDKKAFDRGYAISKPLVEVEEDISKLCKGASRSRRKHLRDRQHQFKLHLAKNKQPLMAADRSMPDAWNILDKRASPKTSVIS